MLLVRTMRISDLLDTRLVLPALAAAHKNEALAQLASRLASEHPEIDRHQLIAVLDDRERQMSTALEGGVAIPHARLDGLTRMAAVLGRSLDGISCDSHDGKPTHLFLLLVVPARSPGPHLKVLATASRLLHDERCRGRLLKASDEVGLLAALRDEENRVHGADHAA